jgi:hypothetical protein
MRLFGTRAVLGASFSLCIACSAAQDRQDPGSNGGSGNGGTSSGVGGGSGGGFEFGGAPSIGGGSGSGGGPTCATDAAEATLIQEPVDIILVLDNSGSMADELQAVEDNINVNFAAILDASMVDYRVILISRFRKDVRAESGESSTSVCISAPLSGLAVCPSPANPATVPAPIFGERFFQYNEKIESTDSFDWILQGYNRADMRTGLTQLGWSEWLRPGAKKVFLEVTDDNEDMAVDTFLTQLTTLAPQHFGPAPAAATFVFHSICGVGEKAVPTDAYLPEEPIEPLRCTGNGNDVTTSGETYQDLSKRTGGLRFPICQFTGYDVVFQRIAEDVITKRQVACDFDIPPPPAGRELDLEKVAVNYTKGDGTGSEQFGQAATPAACQDNAFYIENNRIWVCPQACARIQSDPNAAVDVLFTCESQIIIE